MDVCLVIKHRLQELKLEQKHLAHAARVTESYISQLLNGKKLPPAPERSDIYDKLEKALKLPAGRLAKLAGMQRMAQLQGDASVTAPLLREVRSLVLRKCVKHKQPIMRAIFEKQPLGELERLVTQKLLDVAKSVAREELNSEDWLRRVAKHARRSMEEVRVIILEFLDTDVHNVTADNCVTFLGPLIDRWDIDLRTFGMDVVLNRRLVSRYAKRLEFVERDSGDAQEEEGLTAFLNDPAFSADAAPAEIAFLRTLRFTGKRPTALYYYRELQSLRDPLHFRERAQRQKGRAPRTRPASLC